MNGQHATKNILLVALGGSGRKTAVMLREKISQGNNENVANTQVNLKIISIDFWHQDSGYLVEYRDYLQLLLPNLRIDDCWKALQKDLEVMSEEEKEPWMNIGPISEIELFLAQDAQKSGIRRVDYFLIVHQAKHRIEEAIRNALRTFSPSGDPRLPINVIILGSMVGRTGSVSYIPVIRILNSLSAEFRIASAHSFLFTSDAFELVTHRENEFNFFDLLSRIRKYFEGDSLKSFVPTQILVNEPTPMFTSYRDPERPLPYSQFIENIQKLIALREREDSSSREYEDWLKTLQQVDISSIDSMAEINKQMYKHYHGYPFAIPQNWNTNTLERFFANLVKST